MQLSNNHHPPNWTVDLALGPRWWLLPIAVPALAVAIAFLSITVAAVGYSHKSDQTMTIAFVGHAIAGSFVEAGAPLSATILLWAGDRRRHRVAAALCLAASVIFAPSGRGVVFSLSWFVILVLAYLLVLRVLGLPHWRGQVADRRRGVSIAFLLGLTLGAAVLIAAGSWLFDADQASYSLVWTALVVLTSVLGQVTAIPRSRTLAILGGILGSIPIVICGVLMGTDHRYALELLWHLVLEIAAYFNVAWAICYLHRCERSREAEPVPAE